MKNREEGSWALGQQLPDRIESGVYDKRTFGSSDAQCNPEIFLAFTTIREVGDGLGRRLVL